MSRKLNLNAYLERIGFAGSIAPTLATLDLIHALHPAAIPFENLDPLMGRPVSLELADIERKLVTERRGGYCYEHNLLLMAVLAELDFTVRPLPARVLWSNPNAVNVPPHHMLLAVEISGTTYIADVGFGGLTLTAPLRLRPDIEQETPHETFRLTGGDPDWTLEAKLGEDEWRPLYRFTTETWAEEDYMASNTYLSTDPTSPFRNELRVALSPSGRRLALRDTRLTTYVVGEPTEARSLSSVAELRDALTASFGINLPAADQLDPVLEAALARSGETAA